MKKNLLALSVAAAFGAGASAAYAAPTGDMANDVTGTVLVVPYYTVQNGNATLINIVNTDSERGKALKVRFRGAERSDDVFDFQLFMSPSDMWTAEIYQGADGRAQLKTADTSCTLPARNADLGNGETLATGASFITSRLTGTPAQRAASTREGYVEIINMGDIVSSSTTAGTAGARGALYTATKHVNGVVQCTANILQSIVSGTTSALNVTSQFGTEAGNTGRLDTYATGGLFANVTVINVNEASAWAVEAVPAQGGSLRTRYWSRYWSQTNTAYSPAASIPAVTLDGIFLSGAVAPAQYDFPDLSTPRRWGRTPIQQYNSINDHIGYSYVLANEYITEDSIFAETDWVISFPTRRYGVEGRPWASSVGTGILDNTNTAARQVLDPFADVYDSASKCLNVETFEIFDREERTTTTGVVISPGELFQLRLCGEVAVVSFNNNGASTSAALGAELTLNDATVPYINGWATIAFADGLPAIASAFVKANNGGSGANNMNFGGNWRHRVLEGGGSGSGIY